MRLSNAKSHEKRHRNSSGWVDFYFDAIDNCLCCRAAELNRNQVERTSSAVTDMAESANSTITVEVAEQIAQEIMHADYDYSGFEIQSRGAVSVGAKAVKTVLKFIKQNWSKISKILEKYGVKWAKGIGGIAVIDQFLKGTISISDNIDEAIYTVVDRLAPDLNPTVKRIVANAIRFACPI